MAMDDVFKIGFNDFKLSAKVINVVKSHIDTRKARRLRFSPKELNDVGLCYWYGHIVPKDYRAAVRWYKASAKKKYPAAERNLYICYSQATGVKKDMYKALQWLKKSARHGSSMAQFDLGEYYCDGDFVKKSIHSAKIWLKKSEENALQEENNETFYLLGLLYLYGFDLRPENQPYFIDKNKAIYCFEKSAEFGTNISLNVLLSIYIKDSNKEKVDSLMEKIRASKSFSEKSREQLESRYSEFVQSLISD